MRFTGPAALRSASLLAVIVPAALLAGAYVGQYGFGLYPCELCWWQRYAHFAALGLAVLGLLVPNPRWLVAGAAVAIAVSAAIGGFHAGVEYKWWEGFTACTSPAGGAGGDPLDAIMNAPLIRCDTAQWSLLGISLAGYNFLLSGLGAAAVAVLLGRSRKR